MMPNSKPNQAGLALGRGKRPKLDNERISIKLSSEERESLELIAEQYGCYYGDKPWISGLLRMIASKELLVLPSPKSFDVKEASRRRIRKVKDKHVDP